MMTATDHLNTRTVSAAAPLYRARLPDDEHAHGLLDAALARCYSLPPVVAGFAADLWVQLDAQTWCGTASIDVHQRVQVMLADAAAQSWVAHTLSHVAAHAWDAFGAARVRRAALGLDTSPHPLGARIHLRRDTFHTHYRVCDGAITEYVHAAAPETATTQIMTYQALGQGMQLPQVYTTFACKQGSGRLVRGEATTDTYIEQHGVWLLAERRVQTFAGGTCRAAWLRLDHHRLLEPHEIVQGLRPRAKRQHTWR